MSLTNLSTTPPRDLVLKPCLASCVLDSEASRVLLAKHGIALTEPQLAMFREIESSWDLEVFQPNTAGCLVNGRFHQQAVDGYFNALNIIHPLGRHATADEIAAKLATLFPEGMAFVLYAASVCQVYSDAIAHAAYRLLLESGLDKRRKTARAGVRAYKTNLLLASDALKVAAR